MVIEGPFAEISMGVPEVLQYLELRGIMLFDGDTRDKSEFHEWSAGTPDPKAAAAKGNVWL
jgi:hypothetical protein